jgi:hypothetical protein
MSASESDADRAFAAFREAKDVAVVAEGDLALDETRCAPEGAGKAVPQRPSPELGEPPRRAPCGHRPRFDSSPPLPVNTLLSGWNAIHANQ